MADNPQENQASPYTGPSRLVKLNSEYFGKDLTDFVRRYDLPLPNIYLKVRARPGDNVPPPAEENPEDSVDDIEKKEQNGKEKEQGEHVDPLKTEKDISNDGENNSDLIIHKTAAADNSGSN